MRFKYVKIVLFILFSYLLIKIPLNSMLTVNLEERLPVKIPIKSIKWGRVRAFHPDLLYMKYGIAYFQSNRKITIEESYKNIKHKEFYLFYEPPLSLSDEESTILQNTSAQTFLKFNDENQNDYLLIIAGDHGGSADIREMHIKLFRYDKKKLTLIFNETEIYSVDPGYESYYLTEKFKFYIYKYIFRDERYQNDME